MPGKRWAPRCPVGPFAPSWTEEETGAGRAQVGGPGGESPLHKPEPAWQGKKVQARARGNSAHCQLGGLRRVPDRSGSPSPYPRVGDSNPPRLGRLRFRASKDTPVSVACGPAAEMHSSRPHPRPADLESAFKHHRCPADSGARTLPLLWPPESLANGNDTTSRSRCVFVGPPPHETPSPGAATPPLLLQHPPC